MFVPTLPSVELMTNAVHKVYIEYITKNIQDSTMLVYIQCSFFHRQSVPHPCTKSEKRLTLMSCRRFVCNVFQFMNPSIVKFR
jgi:hypothetical protein